MIKICLDPGHGGTDPGATGNNIIEKNYNLEIVDIIKKLLNDYECEIITTREKDNYVSLDDRCYISNKNNVNCFISIHCNSFSSSSANGFETFSYDGTSQLQKDIHTQLKQDLKLRDRGIKKENYAVLRNTNARAVLIECGFLSSPDDSVFLKNNKILISESIVNGIVKHYSLQRKNNNCCCCCKK